MSEDWPRRGRKPQARKGAAPVSYNKAMPLYRDLLRAADLSGMRDEDIAYRAGVGRNVMWRLRSGRHATIPVLSALAEVLKTEIRIWPEGERT